MKKRLIFGLFLFFTIGVFSQPSLNKGSMNKYKQQWDQIEKLEKDDLPKSAAEVADQVLQKAIAEKNTQQAIKALIYRNKYKIAVDQQESTRIFSDLENLIETGTTTVSDKALLHSMLAELYLDYFSARAWEIRQRTSIEGFVPEDIHEWSKNIFEEKASSHLSESVKMQAQLVGVTTKAYSDIIDLGAASQRMYPTLYDFLINRAIEQSTRITSGYEQGSAFLKSLKTKNLQVKDLAVSTDEYVKLDFSDDQSLLTLQYYKESLRSLMNRGLNEGIIHTEINRNQYLSNHSESYRSKYAYDFLLALEEKNRANDYNVEIIDALTSHLQGGMYTYRYGGTDDAAKENTKKIYDWCKYGIEKYPSYERINILRQRLAQLENPEAQISGQSTYHPDNKDKKFKLRYKNLNEATIKIIDKKTKAVVETKKITLAPKTTYLNEDIEFTIDIDKIGCYELNVEYDKKSNFKSDPLEFNISKLSSFARVSGLNQYEFYVVDRLTGSPVQNAVITIYAKGFDSEKYTELESVQTDAKGLAVFSDVFDKKNNSNHVYKVSKGTDSTLDYIDFPYYSSYTQEPNYGQDIISIFTDRSIYRPGQVVYFKAISTLQQDAKTALVNAGKEYKVSLYNVNYQIVAEKTLFANEFGSLTGEFVLPQGGLTGQYTIKVDGKASNSTQYFSVEEYKRPTFQITFDKPGKTYAFGDQVKLIGHAENFSGIKLQDATVEYNITKSSFMCWWMPTSTETVDNGSVVTKDDGSFEIVFTIPQNDTRKNWFNTIYNFDIQASVTDLNGETQNGNYNFAVGDVSMILNVNIQSQLDKASDQKIQVKATNLGGEPVSASGTYSLYSVLPNDSIKAEIQTGNFSTDADSDLMAQIKKLPSAKYLLSLNAKDEKGREVVARNYFVLYSTEDKQPPIETNEWLIQKQITFNESQNAEIIFGVSATDATILYDLIKGNKVFARQQIRLSNANQKLVIPYKEEYGDNIIAAFTYVINETPYTRQITLNKKEEAKILNLKLEVFRDKLRPGQQEEWRISVKDNKDKPALAELLASMYDSSLDKLRSTNEWTLSRFRKAYTYPSLFGVSTFGTAYNNTSFNVGETYSFDPLKWDYLNWFGFHLDGGSRMMIRGAASPKLSLSSANVVMDEVHELAVSAYSKDSKEELNASVKGLTVERKTDKNKEVAPQIRSNFNETAFFYPQLKTDEKGETIISFIVPESNTTWKFRALAYDKSLNVGTLEALAVSRKELMVTPNMPRFVRQRDKTSISTKISNLSDKTLSGKAYIEFFDPLTDNTIDIEVDKFQNFSLQKDASTSVSWLFDVPADIDMIGVRIVAENSSFSDGEQHVLSVLPDRMLVTESMTMNINGGQTKDFTFDKLINNQSKTLSNHRLTLEYTGNPAWYAVQALPTLSNPTNENSVNWFASYYVNILGASIVKQYPKVSSMIKAWKQQGGDKETLVSKLQRNEELKAVLLEETPWILDAKDETEQMNRLSLLFDLNNTNMQTSQAISKLKDLQNSNGGWSWYSGMSSSRSITQYILYGFSQLIRLGAVEYPTNVKEMQISALKYVDNQILKDYEDLKKHNKDWQKITRISTDQLEYLYTRSDYRDIPINQPTRKAERFYTSVVEKNWTNLNLYERSLLAVVSQRNGNKELADKIMKSVREHATTNDEMGLFWANNTSSVFMSRSAVTVHTFLMEAFRETKAPIHEMDMMKQWLLKQKQTQMWESTHATIDAVYALLSTGSNWLASSGNSEISIDKQVIESANKELGTGYIKKSWSAGEITGDMGKVRIQKTDNGPAWGALYWQYYENLDKITAQKGELNVDKKLFVEKSANNGKSLIEVTESNPLKVGDKAIMRLTVRVDRDMEFVHLKDMRASCFEPVETLSGLRWQNASYYYQSTKDASTNFYFDHLPKGTYVFEYPVYVNRVGEYSNGITTIQCMYAPEFVSHTAGTVVIVK